MSKKTHDTGTRSSPVEKLVSSLLIALCICGFWLYAFGDRFENYAHGRVVQGSIVDIKTSYSSRGGGLSQNSMYHYLVRYDGHEKSTPWIWYASIGDKVYVNYLPEKPAQAYVQWGSENSLVNLFFNQGSWIFSLLALVSLGLAGVQVRDAYVYYRGRK